MLEIPLPERSSINLNNGTLHQSLGTDKLIVGCIIHHNKKTGLSSHSLTTPGEVTSVEPQSSSLHITTSNLDPPISFVA